MDGGGGVAEGDDGLKDLEESGGGLGGVIGAAAELDGAGGVGRHGVPDGAEDVDGFVGVFEEVAPAAFFADFLDGAGEVDVDDVVAQVGEDLGAGGYFVGVGTHELAGDGVVVVVEAGGFEAFAAVDEEEVEHGFGDRIRAAVATGDEAHGGVGVAGEAGLKEGGVEREFAYSHHGGHYTRASWGRTRCDWSAGVAVRVAGRRGSCGALLTGTCGACNRQTVMDRVAGDGGDGGVSRGVAHRSADRSAGGVGDGLSSGRTAG